jgi:anion-transporting  ArsA/GET3 family ATPase
MPDPCDIPPPLDRRLVFVTGKGGVGKSTVAAALGLIAARSGRRTIIAELARRDDVWRVLGAGAGAALAVDPENGAPPTGPAPHRQPGESPRSDEAGAFVETEVQPGLFTISIDPELAMEEYLIDQLPVRALAGLLASSRMFAYLAAATPGLRELLAMGKVWELAQPERRTPDARPYDLVIVDAPATGHGVAFLSAARIFAAAASTGPIARHAQTIHSMVVDPSRSAVLAVASATAASVAETLELREALRAELDLEVARVIVNGVEPRRFSAAEDSLMADVQSQRTGDADASLAMALTAARHAHRRSAGQRVQIATLSRHWGRSPVTLPHLFAAQMGTAQLTVLARLLERRL